MAPTASSPRCSSWSRSSPASCAGSRRSATSSCSSAASIAAGLAATALSGVAALAKSGDFGGLARLAAAGGFWALVLVAWMLAWVAVKRLSVTEPARPFGGVLLKIFIPRGLRRHHHLPVGGAGARPRRALRHPAAAERGVGEAGDLGADPVGRFPPDLPQVGARRLRHRLPRPASPSPSSPTACPSSGRGLLPIGNLVSALPIIGVAPIMVMWFGFDWQSKAAVVVAMTFFPMLVNTLAGLARRRRRPSAT